MIIRYRRFLLTLARELEAGREPVAPWRPDAFYKTWNEIQVERDDVVDSSREAQAVRVPAAAAQEE
jgi:hypothetical protein